MSTTEGFTDRTLNCVGCNESFVFSAGEQQYFKENNLNNDPRRCKTCRAARRNNGNQSSGRKQSVLHEVDCAQCGTLTTVPFVPTQGRPVYCHSCFKSRH